MHSDYQFQLLMILLHIVNLSLRNLFKINSNDMYTIIPELYLFTRVQYIQIYILQISKKHLNIQLSITLSGFNIY